MIVSYTHDDGTVEQVSTDDLSTVESAAIEKVTGSDWAAVERALRVQDPTAMRAVLWTHRKRSNPPLRFSDFDVPAWKRRLTARLEREEIEEIVEELLRDDDSEQAREEALHYLRKFAASPADVDAVWADATGPKGSVLAAVPSPAVTPVDSPSSSTDVASATSLTSTGV
jgi:DNA-directed RNA polymerase subunit F